MAAWQLCWPTAIMLYRCPLDLLSSFFFLFFHRLISKVALAAPKHQNFVAISNSFATWSRISPERNKISLVGKQHCRMPAVSYIVLVYWLPVLKFDRFLSDVMRTKARTVVSPSTTQLCISHLIVGSGAADWCTVSTAASHFCRQATATNPHSLREQVVRIWQWKEHG